jgi:diguanylate cyclase (GGDEF)-like protein
MAAPRGPVVLVLERVEGYQTDIASGVRAELAPHGVPLLIHLTGVREGVPPSLTRLVRQRRVGGLIVTPETNAVTHTELEHLVSQVPGLPVVRIGDRGAGVTVGADNRHGMELIARHLVAQGARRIVAVRGKRHQPDNIERELALKQTLADLGVPLPDELIVDGAFARSKAFAEVRGLLARGVSFDAVAAFNDQSALGAADALADAGLRIGEDVLLTGFDNEDDALFAQPSLTTIDQNVAAQGETAARLLLDLMAGGTPGPVLVPVRLCHRESTRGPAPDTDESRLLQARLTALDTALELSRSLLAAPTMEDVADRIGTHLPRIPAERAFLVLRDEDGPTDRARVALAYEDGALVPAVDTPLDVSAELLPARFAHHLGSGALVLHPLVAGDVELGYLLVDQVLGARDIVADVLSMDLTRVLDVIRATRRLARHADDLERLVAERTLQLKSEIGIRRQAEAELRRVNAELRISLHRDALTGIANRGGFDETLASQWAAHVRSGRALSLILVDVDHFKAYNDRYGHPRGDDALRTIARCLTETILREGDLVARIGGEEFAVVLPNTDQPGAVSVAARLRALVADAGVPHAGSPVRGQLTVSLGVATAHPDPLAHRDELVAAADAALYRVKSAGRDGIACAGDGSDVGPDGFGEPFRPPLRSE